ncbi:protein HGV2-like isoform X1 [Antedon mediterranea]|uniref:protein HGV2-like isoform X1 n=1 Tax=Antedon mediterranea TaxID=105859 RepID=UPI003AF8088E
MGEQNDVKTEEDAPAAAAESTTTTDTTMTNLEDNAAAASSTSADEETGDEGVDIDEVAQTLMAKGKRNLVVGEVLQAVQAFQEASGLLASKYGETAHECGEAYFKYGTALLELARMETGVLGNALDGVPEDADSDDDTSNLKGPEREQIFKDVYSAMAEDSEERKKANAKKESDASGDGKEAVVNGKDVDVKVNGESKKESKAEEEEEKKKEKEQKDEETMETDTSKEVKEKVDAADETSDTKKDVEDSDKAEGAKKAKDGSKKDGAGGSKDESTADDEAETAEDISNFELAWEMLELARVIFLDEDKQKQLQIAHVHLTLGELSMETENYNQSIKDFHKCLELRGKHLDEDDRLLAETHYSLGLVYGLDKDFEKSIESYEKSLNVIDLRIKNLHTTLKEHEAGEEDEKDCSEHSPEDITKEIKELEALIPDINSKIEDSKEMKKNVSDSVKATFASSAFGQSSSSATVNVIKAKPTQKTENATDVSHLMRKKRKPDENDGNDSKKSKNEAPSTNGSAANGDKAKVKQKTVEDVLAAKECSMET